MNNDRADGPSAGLACDVWDWNATVGVSPCREDEATAAELTVQGVFGEVAVGLDVDTAREIVDELCAAIDNQEAEQ